MMQYKLRRRRSRNWYWQRMLPMPAFIWVVILAPVTLALSVWRLDFALTLLGVVLAGWMAYHAKVSHFLQCFSRCNDSYARIKGVLKQAVPITQVCNDCSAKDGANDVIGYFNLCAEEYLMHRMGVIPDFVRDVWRAGMHDCVRRDHLEARWEVEVKAGNLYYGFDLEQIILEHHELHGRDCEERANCPLSQVIARASLPAAE